MKDQRQPTVADRIERTFGRRLRELREERGLSQAKLSEELARAGLHLDSLAILRMEKNADGAPGRRVRVGEAAIIARVLGVRLDEMIRRTVTLEQELATARNELASTEASLVATRNAMAVARQRTEELRQRVRFLEIAISRDEETYSQRDKLKAEISALEDEIRANVEAINACQFIVARDNRYSAAEVQEAKDRLAALQEHHRQLWRARDDLEAQLERMSEEG